MFEMLLQHLSQGDYERRRRQFVALTSQLEQAVVVQQCDGGGYTITYPWQRDDGEVYPNMAAADQARHAVIYQELLATEGGYFQDDDDPGPPCPKCGVPLMALRSDGYLCYLEFVKSKEVGENEGTNHTPTVGIADSPTSEDR